MVFRVLITKHVNVNGAYCPSTVNRRITEAVIKSAASAASLGFAGERPVPRRPHAVLLALPCKSQGGCASSRLDHGFPNSSFGSAGTATFQSF